MVYQIDRNDDSFLKDAHLIDVNTFDFNSKEFKEAVDRSIKRQMEIDEIKYSYKNSIKIMKPILLISTLILCLFGVSGCLKDEVYKAPIIEQVLESSDNSINLESCKLDNDQRNGVDPMTVLFLGKFTTDNYLIASNTNRRTIEAINTNKVDSFVLAKYSTGIATLTNYQTNVKHKVANYTVSMYLKNGVVEVDSFLSEYKGDQFKVIPLPKSGLLNSTFNGTRLIYKDVIGKHEILLHAYRGQNVKAPILDMYIDSTMITQRAKDPERFQDLRFNFLNIF